MKITIFSVPKPFIGSTKIIQTNAIKSWLKLKPKPNIILMGNEKGVKTMCNRFHLKHCSNIKTNKYGTPLVSDVFIKGQNKSKTSIVMYVNCDIILVGSLIESIKIINKKFNKFLIVGKRCDLQINKLLSFNTSYWEKSLLRKKKMEGILKNGSWIDYFVFKKNTFKKIPPFALGRTFWDKWLIWYIKTKKYPIVDVTETVTAIHQIHPYFRNSKYIWTGSEALNNIKLAGGWSHGATINDSDYKLTKNFILKKHKKPFIYIFKNIFKISIDKLSFLYPLLLKIRYWRNKIQFSPLKEKI